MTEESKAVQCLIFLPRRAAAARFLYLSSTAGDAFFLFFHEKEKKEWGAENQQLQDKKKCESTWLPLWGRQEGADCHSVVRTGSQ